MGLGWMGSTLCRFITNYLRAIFSSILLGIQPMVKKILNIEQFFLEHSFKEKLKIIGEFGCAHGIVRKS
jgi:hypothetical protein